MGRLKLVGVMLAVLVCAGSVLTALSATGQYSTSNYTEQGGARTVIGGSLDVVSGGELDVESGGALKIGGTAVSSTAAELNMVDGTPGTVVANKAVVVDANKRVDDLDITALEVGNVDITATGTEINLLDGSTAGNSTASVLAMLDSNKRLQTNAGVGTANTGTTAVEYGDGRVHQTVLTVNTTLPAIAGGADLAVGKLLYTLPAGAHIIESAYMSIAITQTQGNITADTPDVGLGTVIGSGAVATLDGTGTFENLITGQTAANCSGTATVKTAIPTAGVPFVIEAAGAKTIHLNVADGWAASGDAAALLVGTVVINWRTMA